MWISLISDDSEKAVQLKVIKIIPTSEIVNRVTHLKHIIELFHQYASVEHSLLSANLNPFKGVATTQIPICTHTAIRLEHIDTCSPFLFFTVKRLVKGQITVSLIFIHHFAYLIIYVPSCIRQQSVTE